MKKLLFTAACIISLQAVHSQITPTTPPTNDSTGMPDQPTTTPTKKSWKKIDLSNRSNDHLMIQYGFDNWSGATGLATPKGFSRFFNAYAMLDKPFKTNPKMSVGLGLGVGSSNIFFDKTFVDIKSLNATLPFTDVSQTDHFKKFKLTTIYVEAPVELRYSSNPENVNKSFKVALGVKVGYLVNAHTKGKTLQNASGNTINSYIDKENSKRFFNTTKLAGTARIGYGIFSLYGSYQITALFKEGAAPVVHPYSIGLSITGL